MQAMQRNIKIATEGTYNLLRRNAGNLYLAGSMKRVLICVLGALAVVAAVIIYLLFRPDIGARVFLELIPHQ